MAFSRLPGEFYFGTWEGYVPTATNGGGRGDDTAVSTDTQNLGPNGRFALWRDGVAFAIQTPDGHFVTAVSGGGRTSDVLHTNATEIREWEQFAFPPNGFWTRHILTSNNHYLSALGNGGHATNAFHSDALNADTWETFTIRKCGDLGSGFNYYLVPENLEGNVVSAREGGGQTDHAIRLPPLYVPEQADPLEWARMTLMLQPDGTYGIRTLSGNFLTADQGGGLDGSSGNALQTNRTAVQAWEKFTFTSTGDGYYIIQTVSGSFIGEGSDTEGSDLSTNASGPDRAQKFIVLMAGV